jgi:hypothetical protein
MKGVKAIPSRRFFSFLEIVIFRSVLMTVPLSSLALPSKEEASMTSSQSCNVSTNRLRVIPQASIRSDPVRIFEILCSVGEVQAVDFSSIQVDQVIIVTYFDLRAARKALIELRPDFKFMEGDSSYDFSTARSVRIKRDSNLSLDDTMNALGVYGEIERISFSGTDQLVIEFFDTRGPIAVMNALSAGGAPGYNRPAVGGDARKANYSNPPVSIASLPQACSVVGESANDFEINIEAIQSGADIRTTLMIRNIPNKYTQKVLLRIIDLCFKDKYDFFYLPIDYKHRCNVGYAFINFCDESYRESIPLFHELFNDKKWDKFNSEKICRISYARLQGQDALLEHFKSSSVMQQHKQLRPFFTRQGSGESVVSLVPPPGLDTPSVIESLWSETSTNSHMGGCSSFVIPPLSSLNLGTVEGTIYATVHAKSQ